MFDAVAQRYDLTNDILSLGQDRRWRRAVLAAVAPLEGERVLDLAAGTGASSQPFADAGSRVVPCDFSLRMLATGKQASLSPPVTPCGCRSPTRPSTPSRPRSDCGTSTMPTLRSASCCG